MPELPCRHTLHDAGNRLVVVAGCDIARHHLTNSKVKRRGTVLGERAYDIALGQYTGQAPSRAENDDCTDAVCGKRSEERRVGKECRSRWWRYREQNSR